MESSSPGDLKDAQKDFDAGTAEVPETIGDGSAAASGSGTPPAAIATIPFGVPVGAIEFLFNVPFNRVASVKGDHWKLSAEESKGLAECWKPVVDDLIRRFLPNGAELAPLYGALLATSAVVGVRAAKDKQLESKTGKPASTTESTATERSTDVLSSAENGTPENQLSWPASPELSIGLESSTR